MCGFGALQHAVTVNTHTHANSESTISWFESRDLLAELVVRVRSGALPRYVCTPLESEICCKISWFKSNYLKDMIYDRDKSLVM